MSNEPPFIGWPVPRNHGWTIEDWRTINRFQSDAKRAAYIHALLPVNVVLVEAADE